MRQAHSWDETCEVNQRAGLKFEVPKMSPVTSAQAESGSAQLSVLPP